MKLKDYIGEATSYDKKLMLERKDPTSWLKKILDAYAFESAKGTEATKGTERTGRSLKSLKSLTSLEGGADG